MGAGVATSPHLSRCPRPTPRRREPGLSGGSGSRRSIAAPAGSLSVGVSSGIAALRRASLGRLSKASLPQIGPPLGRLPAPCGAVRFPVAPLFDRLAAPSGLPAGPRCPALLPSSPISPEHPSPASLPMRGFRRFPSPKPCGPSSEKSSGSRGEHCCPPRAPFGRLNGYRYPPSTTPKPEPGIAALVEASLGPPVRHRCLSWRSFPGALSIRTRIAADPHRGRPGDPFVRKHCCPRLPAPLRLSSAEASERPDFPGGKWVRLSLSRRPRASSPVAPPVRYRAFRSCRTIDLCSILRWPSSLPSVAGRAALGHGSKLSWIPSRAKAKLPVDNEDNGDRNGSETATAPPVGGDRRRRSGGAEAAPARISGWRCGPARTGDRPRRGRRSGPRRGNPGPRSRSAGGR